MQTGSPLSPKYKYLSLSGWEVLLCVDWWSKLGFEEEKKVFEWTGNESGSPQCGMDFKMYLLAKEAEC